MAIITIEDLLKNKKKIEEEKNKLITLKLKEFDGEVKAKKLTFEEFMEIGEIDADEEVIYNCLVQPNLKVDELILKLNCQNNPIEVVKKVFSRKTIKALSSKILEHSELISKDKDLVSVVIDDIKN
jgi:hypothetical protein